MSFKPALPANAPAAASALMLRRILAAIGVTALVLAALLATPPAFAWLVELRRSGTAQLALAALLVISAGLAGTWLVARRRAFQPEGAGRAARQPQLATVAPLALAGAALALGVQPAGIPVGPPETGYTLGAAAVALAFALLVMERSLAATPAVVVPEAPALRALALTATCICFAAGVLEGAAQLGATWAALVMRVLALVVAAIGIELAVRAAGRGFLPAPPPEFARGAATSSLARILAAGASMQGGIGAPLREHLGIDFSRSWALAYLRAAALPMLAFLVLLGWGLTGVALLPIDQRAVYERFGASVAVLQPGLHFGLPWPLGAVRPVEFGTVHAIGLNEAAASLGQMVGAEDPAPASADRLWEQAHPAEVMLLIASQANNRQSFQSVAADLKIFYRVGLDDASALHATYSVAAPADLVRSTAGRVVSAYFAQRTLDEVLGANREAMAETIRTRVQLALDAARSGLQVVAIVIEAVHPPSGAADAYHNVRAAEIMARASVAVEHGAAATIYAQSQQYAFDQISNARAQSAELVQGARATRLRFTADQDAAHAGGQAFLFERYIGALAGALGHVPKTIIDHRLNWPEAPVLDLRPLSAAPSAIGKEE
jgi:regulator of protease activity HflC (stomatin/prohibitin superfamily)